MALTNDQITAQNFKDFYGQIRPYLNGQVPTFANQFSRSDLYSTDEKIIGCWTDGKPLYQKVIDCGTFPTGLNDDYNIYSLSSGIDFAMVEYAYILSNGRILGLPRISPNASYNYSVHIDGIPGSTLHISFNSGSDTVLVGNLIVVIRYTKSTDSAIKVGTGTDYSTEEQVIGTWIDGKPLYQKTFETTTPANNTDTLIVELPSNCIARSFDGYILQSVYNHIPLNAYYSSAEFVCTYMQFNPDNGIRMKCENTQWRSSTAVITVLYTKTTDV